MMRLDDVHHGTRMPLVGAVHTTTVTLRLVVRRRLGDHGTGRIKDTQVLHHAVIAME